MDTAQRAQLLFDMLATSHGLHHWVYDAAGNCIQTSSEGSVLNAFFSAGASGRQEMLQRGSETDLPVLLGLPLDLVWVAAFEKEQRRLKHCYVLGPALHTEVSLREIQQAMDIYKIPKNWHAEFTGLIRSLPVLSVTSLTRTAVMLHYSVTGVKIAPMDVISLVKPENTSDAAQRTERRQTYMAEQKLLNHIREGNLNAREALAEAKALGPDVMILADTPLAQLNTSLTIFTALCIRAAIDGGITPEVAYAVGENYILRISSSESLSHSESIGHAMYREFIQMVHDAKLRSDLSGPIRSCCDYIGLHLEDELTMDILSRRAGYTVNYLSRKFTEEVGLTPSDYIKKVRIDRACQLLMTTDLPIPEIGFRLRFCNRGYFSAVFKSQMGMTPVEYRKRYQRK